MIEIDQLWDLVVKTKSQLIPFWEHKLQEKRQHDDFLFLALQKGQKI
jgi:hypothetical protein